MNWAKFEKAAPELAQLGKKLFEKAGLVLLGTLRKDGSPRISPVEFILLDGELYFGMMWKSKKALDLLRDPRCAIHNAIPDRFATDGEFKLYARARDVQDPEERKRYCEALRKKIGMVLREPNYHLFAADIESAAAFTNEKTTRLGKRWKAGGKITEFRQRPEDANPPPR